MASSDAFVGYGSLDSHGFNQFVRSLPCHLGSKGSPGVTLHVASGCIASSDLNREHRDFVEASSWTNHNQSQKRSCTYSRLSSRRVCFNFEQDVTCFCVLNPCMRPLGPSYCACQWDRTQPSKQWLECSFKREAKDQILTPYIMKINWASRLCKWDNQPWQITTTRAAILHSTQHNPPFKPCLLPKTS